MIKKDKNLNFSSVYKSIIENISIDQNFYSKHNMREGKNSSLIQEATFLSQNLNNDSIIEEGVTDWIKKGFNGFKKLFKGENWEIRKNIIEGIKNFNKKLDRQSDEYDYNYSKDDLIKIIDELIKIIEQNKTNSNYTNDIIKEADKLALNIIDHTNTSEEILNKLIEIKARKWWKWERQSNRSRKK